ncbi:hypothetical protein K503DRAFT_785499 [Rhizopogon vinicolor AM-OR11-026]|uniref:Uncharacterized protein n=1 Tax=Rhizopogon vinicolor AM-OR11-026 TaxID=1314800 RepID=A0A1B7MQI3_9AGAM|nr:hypothetical protein K503DRAFT_785499 [Rhizopogon vinicolor AM-OR11-026]
MMGTRAYSGSAARRPEVKNAYVQAFRELRSRCCLSETGLHAELVVAWFLALAHGGGTMNVFVVIEDMDGVTELIIGTSYQYMGEDRSAGLIIECWHSYCCHPFESIGYNGALAAPIPPSIDPDSFAVVVFPACSRASPAS